MGMWLVTTQLNILGWDKRRTSRLERMFEKDDRSGFQPFVGCVGVSPRAMPWAVTRRGVGAKQGVGIFEPAKMSPPKLTPASKLAGDPD
jgi:hypothetical protein